MKRFLLFGAILALLYPASARADIKTHPICTDGMVLQQKTKAHVFGFGDAGSSAVVSFRGKEYRSVAGTDAGDWRVTLDNLEAGGPFEMTVTGYTEDGKTKANTITLKDVYVGEVWVCSGQSNMEWKLGQSFQPKDDIEKATNPNIRLFTVGRARSPMPLKTVNGNWSACDPKSAPGFSAVGYYFGRDLQATLKVPVGLIHTSWGGTAAEEWTSVPVLAANPEHKNGNQSTLYNGMLAPLMPFAIKGAIWYQGESNASKPELYRTLFPMMIKNWRDDWKQGDFPFLFVQLAPYEPNWTPGKVSDHNWGHLREAQLFTAQTVKNAGMAVITDVGDVKDIHPTKKGPAGARLALAARAIAYGEKIVYSGPEYDKMEARDGKAILSFKNIGAGLTAKDGELKGFTVAGADNVFKPAKAEIKDDKVIVSSAEVTEPVSVRYGWSGFMEVNLWNKDGLPASPFRTDKLKRGEAKP